MKNMNVANSRDSLLASKIIRENNKKYRERLAIAINSRIMIMRSFHDEQISNNYRVYHIGALFGFSLVIPRYKQLQ